MDRLLSEQEVIRAVNKHTIPSVEIILSEDITAILKEVSSAEPKWIPVSERLPDKNGIYLVTVKQGYITFGAWVNVVENWTQVTAWMPLPKPYKAESEVRNDS